MLDLHIVQRTDWRLLERMRTHYSQPKGFVGRNICYAIYYNEVYYGHIIGGSATKHLKGRHEYLNTTDKDLNCIVNNIFYNISKVNGEYPKRNFTTYVLKEFVKKIQIDWFTKYGDVVKGIETLVEKPRSGELYLKAGFKAVGETIGYTCKRIGGKDSTESIGGKRIWNRDKSMLRPKIVLCYKLEN